MVDLTTSRRRMLGALAVAPVVIGAAAPAAATMCSPSPFAAAFRCYETAAAIELQFDERHLRPAALAAGRAEDAIPHISLEVAGAGRTTRRWEDVDRCRRLARALHTPGRAPSHACQQAQNLVAAAEARLAAIEAQPENIHWDAISRRSDELSDLTCNAHDAALKAPAASVAELARKFAIIEKHDLFEHEDVLAAFREDMARLAAGGLN